VLVPCAVALAQVPTDTVLVLETTATVQEPYYRLVDVFGRGVTQVRAQSVFVPVGSVATDPVDASRFFYHSGGTVLPGTWHATLGPMAAIGTNTWGSLSRTTATRVEVGATRAYTLEGSAVQAVPKAGGTTATLVNVAGAVDLAVSEPRIWVAADGAGQAVPIVEFDLTTGTSRAIGSFVGVRSIAASPLGNELCLGFDTGDLQRVDATTGAVLTTLPTGLGPITAVGYTRFATLVWTDGTDLWSEVAPAAPVFTSSTTILDFGVARAPTASVIPFGRGCGSGSSASQASNGVPTLGNSAWSLGLRHGPVNAFALFALGTDRVFASALGVALPFDLAAFGAPGCPLLVDPLALVFHATSGSGSADQALAIPNAPALAGTELSGQWLVPDGSAFAVTEGVVAMLR
jgi:hypothetical protein